jgi:hypothetical protein
MIASVQHKINEKQWLAENAQPRARAESQGVISSIFNVLHKSSSRSALALLVAAILADDPHHTLAPYDLAVTTDTLDRSAYFHVSSPS